MIDVEWGSYSSTKISKEAIKTRQISDELSLAVAILSLGRGGFSLNTLNLAILVIILTSFIMGLGDAKLFGALTLLFGFHIFVIIFNSFLLATAYILPNLLTRNLSFKDTIPFAPFISIATGGLVLFVHA